MKFRGDKDNFHLRRSKGVLAEGRFDLSLE